ncbi:CapA family protein [Laspinema olomoucense]|uniref:CapA family protein n=1 Tax=Laspinema olomoucense TaxID=3231600 RepID=UPI0021BA7E00|nr:MULTISPECIES: CapA family protein [unclassified Laspinema]MCT7990540.1 CapA family protein [Laspinema sp. D3a]MCT7993039.1 CapA family protein [Laspinema sp. D3c]
MTSFSTFAEPSMLDLARAGNFRAIAYLINSYLAPQGIYARVEPVQKGCLPIRLEINGVSHQPDIYQQLRSGLNKFICYQIWRLNSEVIDGVRIIATGANPIGNSDLLWQQSIRIVTPANQQRRNQYLQKLLDGVSRATAWINYKVFRLFLVAGVSVSAFIMGSAIGYLQLRDQSAPTAIVSPQTASTTVNGEPERPKMVQAALETVPVIEHTNVVNPNDPTVTLMMSGDVTLGHGFEDLIGSDYTWAFDQMPEYREADIAMVNLEGTLTTADTKLEKTFNFKAEPDAVNVLTAGGVDLVNLANNHAMDYQGPGLQETLKTLEKAGIHGVGAGMEMTEARRPKIIDVKGQRIAYFGYYTADYHAAAAGVPGTNHGMEKRIAEDIQAVRDEVDWIVVNFHWGVELANYPEIWQSELAYFTIDQGADVIVGHHPHVLQGAEIYKGRPIAYSLGNFIFGGNARSDYDTAVLKVSLREEQMKVEFLPVEVRKYQPKVVTGERGDRILEHIDLISGVFKEPMTSPMILDARQSKVVTSGNTVFESQKPPEIKSNPTPQEELPGEQDEAFNASPFTNELGEPLSFGEADKLSEAEPVSPPPSNATSRMVGMALAAAAVGGAIGVAGRNKKIKLPQFPKSQLSS